MCTVNASVAFFYRAVRTLKFGHYLRVEFESIVSLDYSCRWRNYVSALIASSPMSRGGVCEN